MGTRGGALCLGGNLRPVLGDAEARGYGWLPMCRRPWRGAAPSTEFTANRRSLANASARNSPKKWYTGSPDCRPRTSAALWLLGSLTNYLSASGLNSVAKRWT